MMGQVLLCCASWEEITKEFGLMQLVVSKQDSLACLLAGYMKKELLTICQVGPTSNLLAMVFYFSPEGSINGPLPHT